MNVLPVLALLSIVLIIPISSALTCYQEFANVSNCGAEEGGGYAAVPYLTNPPSQYWYDGDWSTYPGTFILGQGSFGDSNGGDAGEYFSYYIKPKNALASSALRLKDVYDTGLEEDTITDANYSISAACFDQPLLRFRFKLHGYDIETLTGATMEASCWNGTDWEAFRTAYGDDLAGISEEAMIWDIGWARNQSTATAADRDGDKVADSKDLCPNTELPETFNLAVGRYGDVDTDKRFETRIFEGGKLKKINSNYTLAMTYGCSCKQILVAMNSTSTYAFNRGCTEWTIDKFIRTRKN